MTLHRRLSRPICRAESPAHDTRPSHARALARTGALALAAALTACSGSSASTRPDGLDPETLPAELRDDYEVFAQRCSRCHSLARPLSAGFNDMDQWRNYVARMRRQPSSGISPQDEVQILAFLEYFTAQRRGRNSGGEGAGGSR